MKAIHCNVSGTPTDTPIIFDDAGGHWGGMFNAAQTRCTFALSDSAVGGGHLRWNGQNVNFLLPADPGNYEGGLIGLPTIAYGPRLGVALVNGEFVTKADGKRWLVKGTTEMQAPDLLRSGVDIRPLFRQRQDCGANMLRSLCMGFPFRDNKSPVSASLIEDYLGIAAEFDLSAIMTALANTRSLMPSRSAQLAQWSLVCDAVRRHNATIENGWVELANEHNHSTQAIVDISSFPTPEGILASRGSALTDATPAKPHMHWTGYSAHRETNVDGQGSTRAAAEANPFCFEHTPWPKPAPMIAQEGPKPEGYGNNPAYAQIMGRQMAAAWGGFFHSQEGVDSRLWPGHVEACARAFYEAIR